jgi:hypothetical protein
MITVAGPSAVTSRLQNQQEVADGTMAFRFDKPVGWAFKAGQSLDMTLRSWQFVPQRLPVHPLPHRLATFSPRPRGCMP